MLAAMDAYGFEFQAMSSACDMCLEGGDDPWLAAAAQRAIDEVRRIEVKYSRYRGDSIVSRINAAAGRDEAIAVDDETAALLDFAGVLHEASDGLFDVTSGVLRRAWDFRAARLPDPAALAALLPLVGWQQVHWHAHHIRLPREGMELDFGGFGKEYAADRAAEVLRAAGVQHGFVNLGGDIRVVGPRADGRPWRFGIQHPRQGEGQTIASVEMSTGALATSGDYERFFEHEGRRYCHILDPRTGWPVGCGHPASCVPSRQAGGRAASCSQAAASWASISVTAPACTAAGALSTIAMLKGESALEFLATQGATYLAVDAALRLFQPDLPQSRQFDYGEDQ